MNQIQIFQQDDFKIRVTERNGESWFVVNDVCKTLELSNVTETVKRLEDDELSNTEVIDSIGRKQLAYIVSESGLYSLVMLSRKPEAKQFKRWITHEVVPTIRKHGGYLTSAKIEEVLSDPDTIIKLATDLKLERQKRIDVEKTNHILMHVNKTYTATEIAKELGFKSAQALNEDLHIRGIQFKQNDTWVMYSKYADLGYVEIKQEPLDNGKVIYHRRWTQFGREFLLKLYFNKV